MKTIDPAQMKSPIEVPRKVATCPICDADIWIDDIDGWESESGKPTSIKVNCTTEPDIDGDDWPDWFHGHWSMPYVDWLPVEQRVLMWFQRTHKCIWKGNRTC